MNNIIYIIFRSRRLGGNELESELATDGPHCWHLRARGGKHGRKCPTIGAIGPPYELS